MNKTEKRPLRVGAWRKARRIKQAEFAKAIKVSVQALSAIEQGRSIPRAKTLAAMLSVLKLATIQDLYLDPPTTPRSVSKRERIEDLERAARIIQRVAEIAERSPDKMPLVMQALRKSREQLRTRRTDGK